MGEMKHTAPHLDPMVERVALREADIRDLMTAANDVELVEVDEALRAARLFIQDTLDTQHVEGGALGNLMSARDCIDKAIGGLPDVRGEQYWRGQFDASQARVRELEADARRYRYLRDRDPGPTEYTPPGLFIGQVPENLILTGEEADQAIDAAIDRGDARLLKHQCGGCGHVWFAPMHPDVGCPACNPSDAFAGGAK